MAHATTDPAQPGHRRIGALLLIRNPDGHVLLVQPSYRDGLQLVGGGAKPNEPAHVAAVREAREETGLSLTCGDLLLVDQVPASATSVEGYNLIFDGGVLADGTTITLPVAEPGEDPELIGYAWVAPDRLVDHCTRAQRRRILAALAALAVPARHRYLTDGHRPTQQQEAA